MESFFLSKTEDEDWLYSQIRDCSERVEIKKQIECFWEKYRKYAPVSKQDFLSKIQKKDQFKQRWWEMVLSIGLLNIGREIQKKTKEEGPDILINNHIEISPRIHIEAIAPKKGEKEDKLPEMKFGVYPFPEKEILFRLTGAFVEKSNKYNDYINTNKICESDIYIIAISSCDLSEYGSLTDGTSKAPLKFSSGVGPLILSPSGSSFKYRPQIKKISNSPVEMNYFLKKKYNGISALLYSNTSLLDCPDKPEEKFVVVKNPIAKNSVPNILFKGIEIWVFDKMLKTWKIEK